MPRPARQRPSYAPQRTELMIPVSFRLPPLVKRALEQISREQGINSYSRVGIEAMLNGDPRINQLVKLYQREAGSSIKS